MGSSFLAQGHTIWGSTPQPHQLCLKQFQVQLQLPHEGTHHKPWWYSCDADSDSMQNAQTVKVCLPLDFNGFCSRSAAGTELLWRVPTRTKPREAMCTFLQLWPKNCKVPSEFYQGLENNRYEIPNCESCCIRYVQQNHRSGAAKIGGPTPTPVCLD